MDYTVPEKVNWMMLVVSKYFSKKKKMRMMGFRTPLVCSENQKQ